MQVIDAHQHFWNYDPHQDGWITNDMQVLKRNFLPDELAATLAGNNVSCCVAVQARQTKEETEFLLDLSAKHDFIKAVVGWVDPESPGLEQELLQYKSNTILKGFRPMLQPDQQRNKMLNPDFVKGIALFEKYGYTLDLIILPDQLPFAVTLASMFPEMKFVINHLGKPALKDGTIAGWKNEIGRFRELKNVYCKISGLVTQADWTSWTKEDFYPVTDHVVETFGTSRIVFGSDWPVCLLAAEYNQVRACMEDYFSSFPLADQQKFFAGNAIDFYSIGK